VALSHFLEETFHAFLEYAILGGVDERIDTVVGDHQHQGGVVQPASEVERVTQKVEYVHNLDG